MAVFDESKVISTLHKDKAEVGKRYYFSDYIGLLNQRVERDNSQSTGELIRITDDTDCCFIIDGFKYALLYPYEEPPKKRMTYRQLSEWLAKGNGQYTTDYYLIICTELSYCNGYDNSNDEVPDEYTIRAWGSDEWIEPTEEIYLRDCKHISQDDIAYRDGC